MRAQQLRIPATLRNANFLAAGLAWSVLAVAALGASVASGFRAGTTGYVILITCWVLAGYYLASWFRRRLSVLADHIVIGRVFSELVIPYDRVQEFAIREPRRRTPFMLAFHWWADEATVTLTDGSVHRIAGLAPWHGFTALSYFAIIRPTVADAAVEWLNECCGSAPL